MLDPSTIKPTLAPRPPLLTNLLTFAAETKEDVLGATASIEQYGSMMHYEPSNALSRECGLECLPLKRPRDSQEWNKQQKREYLSRMEQWTRETDPNVVEFDFMLNEPASLPATPYIKTYVWVWDLTEYYYMIKVEDKVSYGLLAAAPTTLEHTAIEPSGCISKGDAPYQEMNICKVLPLQSSHITSDHLAVWRQEAGYPGEGSPVRVGGHLVHAVQQ